MMNKIDPHEGSILDSTERGQGRVGEVSGVQGRT